MYDNCCYILLNAREDAQLGLGDLAVLSSCKLLTRNAVIRLIVLSWQSLVDLVQ